MLREWAQISSLWVLFLFPIKEGKFGDSKRANSLFQFCWYLLHHQGQTFFQDDLRFTHGLETLVVGLDTTVLLTVIDVLTETVT